MKPEFWFLARCTFCGWTARTQSKTEFDRDVKGHRQAHQVAGE